MTTWIAFLRGVNMGGHGRLPMQALRILLESLDCGEVRTYIQSGNAVFRHEEADAAALAGRIGAAIAAAHGFAPAVLLLTREQLERAVAANPFPEAEAAPRSLALLFLDRVPERPDLARLERIRAPSEAFALDGATCYLHLPEGFGRSKLAARAERLLGVEATGRNWRTVRAVLELARALD